MTHQNQPSGASIVAQVEALRRMGLDELRQVHCEVFGEKPRSSNRQHLYRQIAWRIQADALGEDGLSQGAKLRIEELAPETLLQKAPQKATTGAPKPGPRHDRPVRDSRLPQPGTLLIREYRGNRIEVEVLEKGFVYDGKSYRSLSAIAREITGSHWNGLLFFSLTRPKGQKH